MSVDLPSPIRDLLALPDEARQLGPYRLKRQLGRGGFAPVWLAEEVCGDTTLRLAAVKLFALEAAARRAAAGDAGRVGRADQAIIDEARRLCQVEHPGIVRFYALSIDEARDVIGLAMEHVAGETLGERLAARGKLPVREVLDVGAAVASALSAVHAAGLVHRDVSPANIIVHAALDGPGAYKLIDFGISAAQPRARGGPPGPGAKRALGGDLPLALGGTQLSDLPRAMSLPADLVSPLTAVGGKLGYVDPVCWRELSPATLASDLYGLGAVLFVCLTGRIPAAGTGALRGEVLNGHARAPRALELAPDTPPELAQLVDALLDPDPAQRPRSAERIAIQLERLRAEEGGRALALPPEEEGPFRGLHRFEVEHRDIFFGRRVEVAATLEMLRARGLVALLGPSGSGKSSLARAGVLPAIADGALGGPARWDTVIVAPGSDPRTAIAAGLFHMNLDATRAPEDVIAAMSAWLQREQQGLVLLVDQLEELATLAREGDEHADGRRWTIELLARLGERPLPGLRVLVTARRDMLEPILAHSDLGRVMMRGAVLVTPISDAAWGEVIDAALETYGYAFEDDDLRRELLGDLRGTAGAMPLVEFALMRLWGERDPARKQITRAGMRAVGGLAGALERYAEATLAHAQREGLDEATVRRVLLALTTPEGTRATRPIDALLELAGEGHPRVHDAIAHLEAARLLVLEREGLTLAHEALLTQWGRLRAWLAEVQQARLFAGELDRAARSWAADPADADLLWRGRRLDLALDLVRAGRAPPSAAAARFLHASRTARTRRRAASAGTLAALALAIGAILLKYGADLRAEQQNSLAEKERAERSAQEALTQKDAADRARSEAIDARRRADENAEKYYKTLADLTALLRGARDTSELAKLQQKVRAEPEPPAPPEPEPEPEPEPPDPAGPGEVNGDAPPPPPDPPDVDLPPPASTGIPAASVDFNLGAAHVALQAAARRAADCGRLDGPRDAIHVQVLFDPAGHVAAISLDKPFQGTERGACVERAFRAAAVPPFGGSPVPARKTVRLQ